MPEPPWDAFLSYAHIDDEAPPAGWVKRFYVDLNARLIAVAPSLRAKIWADFVDLPGVGAIHDHISAALAQSHLFLSVVSPAYADSDETLSELFQFLEREHIGEPKAVKLAKLPLNRGQELPEILMGARGYTLHDREGIELTGEARDQMIAKLAYEIRELIEQARRGPRAKVLLLAGPGREADKESALVELRLKGYQVFPAGLLPRAPERRAEVLEKYFGLMDFAVLLLGPTHSPELESVYDALLEKLPDAAPVRCLLGVPRVAAADAAQKAFTNRAEQSNHKAISIVRGAEWVVATLDQLDVLLSVSLKPTVYLRYPRDHVSIAQEIRARISMLSPDFDILDPLADERMTSADIDTLGRERAHGILVFGAAEQFLTRTLQELRRAVRALIGVYADDSEFAPPANVRFRYRVVYRAVPDTPTPRRLSLEQFLEHVRLGANQ